MCVGDLEGREVTVDVPVKEKATGGGVYVYVCIHGCALLLVHIGSMCHGSIYI